MKKSFNILLMAGMLFSISEISAADSPYGCDGGGGGGGASTEEWVDPSDYNGGDKGADLLHSVRSGRSDQHSPGRGFGGGDSRSWHSNVPDYKDDGLYDDFDRRKIDPVHASSFGLKRIGIGAAGLFGTFLLGTGIVNDQTKTAAAGAGLLCTLLGLTNQHKYTKFLVDDAVNNSLVEELAAENKNLGKQLDLLAFANKRHRSAPTARRKRAGSSLGHMQPEASNDFYSEYEQAGNQIADWRATNPTVFYEGLTNPTVTSREISAILAKAQPLDR